MMSSAVRFFRHVDGLRNCARDKRLRRRHHADMARVMDEPRAVLRPETAIEHRQMLRLQIGGTFNGAGGIDVRDNSLGLLRPYSQA